MLAFPSMLIGPAEEAGIEVPEFDENNFQESIESFRETHPHFYVFCMLQLGKSMHFPSEAWENAKVLGELSKDEIVEVTAKDLVERGFSL